MPHGENLRECWDAYERDVIPEDASVVQVVEARRAFYAGASCLFRLAVSVTADDSPVDVAVARMKALNAEIDRFVVMIHMGRA